MPTKRQRRSGGKARGRDQVRQLNAGQSAAAADDARRAAAARRRGAPGNAQAPWGSFPLTELVVLVALIMLVGGFFVSRRAKPIMIGTGLVLGSLAGLELSAVSTSPATAATPPARRGGGHAHLRRALRRRLGAAPRDLRRGALASGLRLVFRVCVPPPLWRCLQDQA